MLLRETISRFDQNKSGRLEPAELEKLTMEDKTRLIRAGMGGSWWASVLYSVTPNWQLFWLADALDSGKSTFQWGYVGKAFGYVIGYVGASLAVAAALFEDRELS